jgi:hypothetical protein
MIVTKTTELNMTNDPTLSPEIVTKTARRGIMKIMMSHLLRYQYAVLMKKDGSQLKGH